MGYVPNMGDGTVSVVDLVHHKVTGVIDGFSVPWGAVVTHDGTKLFVDDSPPTRPAAAAVAVVDLRTGAIVKRIPTRGLVESSMSHDGRFVYSSNIASAGIQQIATATGEVVASYDTRRLSQEAVTHDQRTLWVIAPNGVYPIDVCSGRRGRSIRAGRLPTQVSISVDGSTLAVTNTWTGRIALVDTRAGTVTSWVRIGALQYPAFGAMSPDGHRLWIGCYSGLMAVVDLSSGSVVERIDVGGWAVGVGFSPDGRTAYVTTTPARSVVPWLGAAYLVPALLGRWKPGGVLRAYNTDTFEQQAEIVTGNIPMAIAIPHPR